MNNRQFLFSVIIPIYNVEKYLAETIESVINQSIGFKKNIELILVNDGSPDNSEQICLEYKEKYPDNIKYINQKNSGVSKARNKGLSLATGKYINFLDSDDLWSKNTFKDVLKMFRKHCDLNIVACRMKFFEARTNFHPLDFKFDKNKVISIHEDYDHIQLSSSSVFFKSEVIKKYEYDFNLKYSEDGKLMSEILLDNEKIGYIKNALYLYRKRFADNSAINTKNSKKEWYIDTPLYCYNYLFELSKKKFGKVIPYIQYVVMYDYQFRLKEGIPDSISDDVKKEYFKITKNLLNEIDDKIILEQKRLPVEYKIEALKIKYGRNVTDDFIFKKNSLEFNDNVVIDFENSKSFTIETINYNDSFIEFRGFSNIPLDKDDFEIYCVVNDKKKYKLDLVDTKINERKVFNELFATNKGFKLEFPSKSIDSVRFLFVYKRKNETTLIPNFSLNTKIDNNIKLYYVKDDVIYFCTKDEIKVVNNSFINRFSFGIKYIVQLLLQKKFKILVIRFLVFILKIFKKNEIWLVSDRPLVANDNGYAFYKYCCDNREKGIHPYFVISKSSKDFDKVKNTGDYLIYNSLKYKLYFLLADKIISSQADIWVYNAFGKSYKYYKDLYNFDLVFLQHGIIKEDLSAWLNYYQKNFKIFVTSANDEYSSIIDGDYGFDKDVVKLTGLPRYDLLNDNKEKLLLIMPTWRKSLAGNFDNDKGTWEYNSHFKESDYFIFYNKLINDEKLLECMKKNKYKGIFVIHPSHSVQAKDFVNNDVIKVECGLANYSDLFSRGSLLITDYSSIMFDFAYLKKASVYTQFDYDKFFSSHIYTKGYFDYEQDGFGTVTYNYDDTINEVIRNIENDCKLDSKYDKRIDKFYKYTDKNNCKRVYDDIKKL